MELRCPQCDKIMQVSAEEVALHGGAVVCPQCLAVFDATDSVPQGTIARRPTVRVIEEHLAYEYCPHCGHKIPQGVNFCPYCGTSLKAIAGAATPATALPEPQLPQQATGIAPITPPDAAKPPLDTAPEAAAQQPKWNPILPGYRYAKTGSGWRSGAQRAGVRFTLAALAVIVAELAILAFTIYKINLLN